MLQRQEAGAPILQLSASDVLRPVVPTLTIPNRHGEGEPGKSGIRHGVCLGLLSIAVTNTTITSHLGEERVYFTLKRTGYPEGTSGEELKQEPQGRV